MAISQNAMTVWSKFMLDKNKFSRFLDKVKLITANHGKCTAELTIAEEHTNAQGTLHGGLSATLVDCISTIALVTDKRQAVGVSVDLHVSFLKPAAIGEKVIIEANTLRCGKSLAFLEVFIKNMRDDSLVARGSHTKFVGTMGGQS